MPDKYSPTATPLDLQPDPTDDALPLDAVVDDAAPDTAPAVPTARDDDEGGADPVDPDTGAPYPEEDAGVDAPPATRTGGTSDR